MESVPDESVISIEAPSEELLPRAAVMYKNHEGTIMFKNDNGTYAIHFLGGIPAKWNARRDEISRKVSKNSSPSVSIQPRKSRMRVPYNL